MKISRRGAVEPFLTIKAFAEANDMARAGHDIIHLSLGQPGVEAPAHVLDKLAHAMKHSPLGYTDSCGLPALRARIAQHYKETYDVEIPASRIFITIGSSSALLMSLIAAFDKGDEVAIATPCYPAYPSIMTGLDVTPVYMEATHETRFQPTPQMLAALPKKPEGLIVASPSNPAGTVLAAPALKELATYCDSQGIRVIADEIYHGITYGESCETILKFSQSAIVINSFSKYFLLPGWRLGWAVIPEDLVESFEALAQNFFISPSAIGQYAALEVMNCKEELDEVVKSYARNRELLLRELPRIGFTKLAPVDGGFFIYADVSELTNDSVKFCRDMLHETGILAASGVDFDRARGKHYVRFSFSNSEAKVAEAIRRLHAWMDKRQAA